MCTSVLRICGPTREPNSCHSFFLARRRHVALILRDGWTDKEPQRQRSGGGRRTDLKREEVHCGGKTGIRRRNRRGTVSRFFRAKKISRSVIATRSSGTRGRVVVNVRSYPRPSFALRNHLCRHSTPLLLLSFHVAKENRSLFDARPATRVSGFHD